MSKFVTISYENGTVTVLALPRIKVYHKFKGSIIEYIMSEDEDHLTLIVPSDVKQFYEGRIVWDVKTFRKTDLNGFDFYPEVTVLETRNYKGRAQDDD
jgi:hypothetical protein